MKNRKKLLSLVLAWFILMMTGCGVCHKNIVKSVVNNCLLIEDVNTHQERVMEMNAKRECRSFMEHVHPGDTVLVRTPYYEERFVLQSDVSTVIYFNYDSIIYRQNKAEFEAKKQEMFKNVTR